VSNFQYIGFGVLTL